MACGLLSQSDLQMSPLFSVSLYRPHLCSLPMPFAASSLEGGNGQWFWCRVFGVLSFLWPQHFPSGIWGQDWGLL